MGYQYHINDKNEVKKCQARKKCRFARKDTVTHFDSMDEAAAHLEKKNEHRLFPNFSNENVFSNNTQLKKLGNELIKSLSINGEFQLMTLNESRKYVKKFEPLGNGVSHNVYKVGNCVVKIPNSENFLFMSQILSHEYDGLKPKWTKDEEEFRLFNMQSEQKAFDELLSSDITDRHNIQYVPTKFFLIKDSKGNKIPIQFQEFISKEDYDDTFEFTEDFEKELMEKYPLDDLSRENICRHRKTGQIVLFDCIWHEEF